MQVVYENKGVCVSVYLPKHLVLICKHFVLFVKHFVWGYILQHFICSSSVALCLLTDADGV
jgi:hypothetical protein